jgi:hypothetical protein
MPPPTCLRAARCSSLSPMQVAWLLPWATAKAAARMRTNPDLPMAPRDRAAPRISPAGRVRAGRAGHLSEPRWRCPVYCKWGAGATCPYTCRQKTAHVQAVKRPPFFSFFNVAQEVSCAANKLTSCIRYLVCADFHGVISSIFVALK